MSLVEIILSVKFYFGQVLFTFSFICEKNYCKLICLSQLVKIMVSIIVMLSVLDSCMFYYNCVIL